MTRRRSASISFKISVAIGSGGVADDRSAGKVQVVEERSQQLWPRHAVAELPGIAQAA